MTEPLAFLSRDGVWLMTAHHGWCRLQQICKGFLNVFYGVCACGIPSRLRPRRAGDPNAGLTAKY